MTGVLGGFTTFSAFSLETFLLLERGRPRPGARLRGRLGGARRSRRLRRRASRCAARRMTGVRQIDGRRPTRRDQRLDRWLRRHYPHVPQGRIERLCRKGEIRVDGGRVRPATRLAAGQTVRLPPMPGCRARPSRRAPAISEADAAMIRACVIWRDDDVIALNKPPGLAVQGGSGQRRHVDALAEALRFGRDEKPRLVHRLDRDTSGVLLLARSARAAAGARPRLPGRATRARSTGRWSPACRSPRAGTIRYGLVKAPGHGAGGEGEKMRGRAARRDRRDRGRPARHHRLRGDRGGGQARRLGGAARRSPGAPTSCARTWPRSATRSSATASTAATPRRTPATAGARSSAAGSAASCTCTPAALELAHPVDRRAACG